MVYNGYSIIKEVDRKVQLITRDKAVRYLHISLELLNKLQKDGDIVFEKLGKSNIYNLANLNEYVLSHSNGRIQVTDEVLSSKEAYKYLGCDSTKFNRLCKKYDFAMYKTSDYKSAKTFYKFEDLKRYKDEFERIKRIKDSM